MERLWRLKAILIKTEVTYGTDSVPTGAANAMLATNVRLAPVQGQDVSRNLDTPYLGSQGSIPAGEHVALDFDIEMAGGGAVDTPPKYAPLLLACGFAETVNALVSVEYNPVSASFSSVSIYINIDGVRHVALGSRGNVAAVLNAQGIPVFRFSFLGLLVPATDVALPTIDTSAFQDPLIADDSNTPTFTLHGYAGVLAAFELNMRNQLTGRFLIGKESILISDRPAGGSLTYEAPLLATFDPFVKARPPKPQGAIQIVHGTAAGNIVQIDAGQTELGRSSYDNTDGVVHYVTPFDALPTNAGNDEVKITTK